MLYQLSYSRRDMRGGGGWIRTTEGERRQIYSLLPLATRVLLLIVSRAGALFLLPFRAIGAGEGT